MDGNWSGFQVTETQVCVLTKHDTEYKALCFQLQYWLVKCVIRKLKLLNWGFGWRWRYVVVMVSLWWKSWSECLCHACASGCVAALVARLPADPETCPWRWAQTCGISQWRPQNCAPVVPCAAWSPSGGWTCRPICSSWKRTGWDWERDRSVKSLQAQQAHRQSIRRKEQHMFGKSTLYSFKVFCFWLDRALTWNIKFILVMKADGKMRQLSQWNCGCFHLQMLVLL